MREREQAPVAHAPGSDRGSVGGPRALVVESDPIWQARLAELLASEGCTADFATTYAEASRKLLAQPARHPYQLLTVDLYLPPAAGGSGRSAAGYDLLESLYYFDRTLPTMIVSAEAGAEEISRAFRDFGVRDFQAKAGFAPQAVRARVRELLQTPFYVVAALETGPTDYLVLGQPCTLSLRIQRDAPLHLPPLGAVRCLLRPPTAAEWPITVVVNSPDLPLDVQPAASQLLRVPAGFLAPPLTCTLIPLAAGNGRIELEFHQPGQFVDRLALDVSARAE